MPHHVNQEFKARCSDLDLARSKIRRIPGIRYIGTDHQVDTYYEVPKGRLKLRTGNIENCLVFYERPDVADSKSSRVAIYEPKEPGLYDVLQLALKTLVVVKKVRAIYFDENVKIHLDSVNELGDFLEVEAQNKRGVLRHEVLLDQIKRYKDFFRIKPGDFISGSYSDMLLELNQHH